MLGKNEKEGTLGLPWARYNQIGKFFFFFFLLLFSYSGPYFPHIALTVNG